MSKFLNSRQHGARLLGALVAASVSTHALATVSVTNRDDVAYKVTIIEAESEKVYSLPPNEELKDICKSGCVLRLNDSDDDEYQLEPNDVVSIEGGALFYDNPDADAEPNQDAPKQDAPKADEPKKN